MIKYNNIKYNKKNKNQRGVIRLENQAEGKKIYK